MPKTRVKAVAFAIVVPILLQMVLEVFVRWWPLLLAPVYHFCFALVNLLAVGGFCFFSAFRPRVAAGLMVVYVPLMMFVIVGAMFAFAWFVYGAAL